MESQLTEFTYPPSNSLFKKPVFLFDDYQVYISDLVDTHGNVRGMRARLADAANCQPGYLTQVLRQEAHLSLDQLYGIANYLGLTRPEWDFLRELWLLARAGSPSLREECENRLSEMRRRFGGEVGAAESANREVNSEKYNLFGTSWHHGALYVALDIPRLRNAKALADHFHLPIARIREVLVDLQEMGMAKEGNGIWTQTTRNFVMHQDSPIFQMYRTSWFMKGIQDSLLKEKKSFRSGASLTLSRARFEEVGKRLKKLVTEEAFIKIDPEETRDVVAYIGCELFEV